MDKFPKEEIEQLLRRIKNDDQSAFNRLIDLKSKNLQNLAYTYLRDHMLAEDVVSEVFYELVKRRGQFKSEKNLNGWLNVVAINKALNILKKRGKEVYIAETSHDEIACNEENYYNKDIEHQIHIRNCLLKLEEDERQVIILYRYYGYKLREICQIMDLTINKVRGLLERAENNFKDCYKN